MTGVQNDNTTQQSTSTDEAETARAAYIETIVGEWLSVPDLAEAQGLRPADVRNQLKDGEFVAVRRGPNNAIYVPAAFVSEGAPLARLKGTLTVLRDGGMTDSEIIEWLFSPDETLPGGGNAMDAFTAGFVTEVRRRAMESAM